MSQVKKTNRSLSSNTVSADGNIRCRTLDENSQFGTSIERRNQQQLIGATFIDNKPSSKRRPLFGGTAVCHSNVSNTDSDAIYRAVCGAASTCIRTHSINCRIKGQSRGTAETSYAKIGQKNSIVITHMLITSS